MDVINIFNQLYQKYGPQDWWPILNKKAENDNKIFEICVGAILTQNTAWTNVEKALNSLIKANLMTPEAVLKCPIKKLQKYIRSSGYYKQKAKKLKIFSQWVIKKYHGNWQRFFRQSLEKVRKELLLLWGIGPETADSILLYAGHKPIFVIDAYTKRLCHQYGVEFKTYNEYQNFFEKKIACWRTKSSLVLFFQEYHALIVKWGKEKSQ